MEIKKLKHLGEFGLIERLNKKIRTKNKYIIVGIGDDTAVIDNTKNTYQLITCDMLIENVHFSLKYFTPFQIGAKATAVNFSDIAACGGISKYILVSIGMNKNTVIKFVDEVYRGINFLCNKYNVDIIGGDTVSSDKTVINICCIGEVKKKNLITRRGAKIGDLILTTGYLGNSLAGLKILKEKIDNKKFKTLVLSHLMPKPRIKEVQMLLNNIKINSAIDISDGISGDIIKLAKASDVGILLYKDKLPISKELKEFCRIKKLNHYDIALSGGEDYELLFTTSEKNINKLKKLPIKTTVIGKIIHKKYGYLIEEKNNTLPLKEKSYNHFL